MPSSPSPYVPFAPALLRMFDEMVSVLTVSTVTARLPAATPPAVNRPRPEIVVAVAVLLSRPPLARLSVFVASVPRSTSARSVTLRPLSVVVPARVSVKAGESDVPASSGSCAASFTLMPSKPV